MRKSPVVVGVDCEGNNQLIPMMVQIATPEFIIIETPKSRTAGLSADLRRLIADRSILKVLCDPGGKDVWSLDLGFWDRSHGMWPSMGWCDIEYMCNMVYGQGKTRGLVGVFNRVQPNVRLAPKVSKDWKLSPVSYFIYRERENKEYIGDERDVPKNVWKYSAADAWITLKAYQHLTQLPRCRPSQYDPPTIALATLTVSSTPPRTDNVSPQSQPSPSSLQQPQHTTPYTVLSILQSQQQLQQQQLYNREYPQIVYNYNVFNQSVARDQQQQHRLRPQPHQQSYTYPRPQRPYQHYNTLYTCHDYNREQAVAAAALHTQNQDNSA